MIRHPAADMTDEEFEAYLESVWRDETPDDDEDWRLVVETEDNDNPDDCGAVDMIDSPVYDRR